MNKLEKRTIRKKRVRGLLHGTDQRPRLCVVASERHIYAQLIDDNKRVTLAATSTLSREVVSQVKDVTKREAAKVVGLRIAELAQARGIKEAIFDRGSRRYHGCVQELAQAARQGGLKL